ncbi:helix-turn-helix domain-containing protein [Vibrio sp. FNV 38]|nr:helix-turn-helix domain-containing protein [Vibrio sp. FNV 38]
MRSLLLFHVIFSCWLISIPSAQAVGTRTSVFYPLPTLSQGKVFATQQLYASETGGVWIHDVHGDVYFFDGETVLPSQHSVFPRPYSDLTYTHGVFWTFEQHKIYRLQPNIEPQVEIALTPGLEIQTFGARGDWLWFSDERHFYTYHIEQRKLETFSLKSLYQQNQSSQIYITDAELVLSQWVLATNSGVYVLNGTSFQHISVSGKRYIEKLHYSVKRQEMVVGTLNGALVFGIHNQTKMPRYIGHTHVLSIAETHEGYWVGTENGLFLYDASSGEITQLQSSQLSDFNLVGDKVYALVNDDHGGVWVGSDRGVRYHSLFSRHFERLSANDVTKLSRSETALYLTPNEQSEGYWLATDKGLYKFSLRQVEPPKQVYQGEVLDVAQYQEELILATSEGIMSVDLLSGKIQRKQMPKVTDAPKMIEMSSDNILWGVSGHVLWQYNMVNQEFSSLGSEWWISHYLPARVTELFVSSDNDVMIGTDHGLYILQNNRIQFMGDSAGLGEVTDIKVDHGGVWVAAAYGVYRIDRATQHLDILDTVSSGLGARCLLMTDQGMWLSSSMGLSFYQPGGELLHHYSAPFGTINNEFLANICVNDPSDTKQLIFGTRSGILSFDSDNLLQAVQPKTQIIFSQVNVNFNPVSTGSSNQTPIIIGFGDSISFLIGTFPSQSGNKKYYRLDDDKDWTPLEGRQITIDRLQPGKHQIDIRLMSPLGEAVASKSLSFVVSKPWYATSFAILCFILLFVSLIIVLILWRSRRVMLANHYLRAQIALKTDQLKHHSRSVLNSNKMLRKQIEIRQMLLTQLGGTECESLCELREISTGFDSGFIHRLSNTADLYERVEFDLLPLTKIAVSCWEREYRQRGIEIKISHDKNRACAMILQLNLDAVLNVVLASSLTRLSQGDVLTLQWTVCEEHTVLTIRDQGRGLAPFVIQALDEQGIMTFETLPHSVGLSGGQIEQQNSEHENTVALTWVAAYSTESELSDTDRGAHVIKTISRSSPKRKIASEQAQWLRRVEALLTEHYADPQFGTAQVAKMLYTSERNLQRKFKSMTTKTFTEALIDYRLEKACEKLLSGQRISDVAFECGFNDHSYFSQRFKLHFGLSPSQFVDTQIDAI